MNRLICPSCHTAPVESISLIPLPANKFEEASRLREQNPPSDSSVSGYSRPSWKKRDSANPTLANMSPISRTGRWSTAESSLVDKLIESFDAGLLPLPQGIKLKDFLCTLLLCRTSRLTKKLKHEKISSRSYRSIGAQGGSTSSKAGADIQRAQALFLQTLEPAWMQTELRLNMSRCWREQFEKFCLQEGFRPLDTTEWNTSLNNILILHSEDSLEAKQKRLKHALSDDMSAAAKSGFDAGKNLSQELRLILKKKESHQANQSALVQDRLRNLDSVAKDLESSCSRVKFRDKETLRHVSSFGSFVDLLTDPIDSKSQLTTTSEQSEYDTQGGRELTKGDFRQDVMEDSKPTSKQAIDGIIDSVVKEAFAEGGENSKFLRRFSNFLTSIHLNFQHCDMWVPTESTGSEATGGQVRLINAGHITFKRSNDPSHVTNFCATPLSEFGVYSQTFSFAPSSGLPGRVFASGQSIWMNHVSEATVQEFGLVGGARMYGVRTAVGLHVPTSTGTLVVVLYSTADLTRDIIVENQCMNFFRQLNPTPKWHLSIDVADDETKGKAPQLQGQAYAYQSSSSCIIPPSPVTNGSKETLCLMNERSLATLLGNHVSSGNDVADSSMTLRFLLLRHPSCRSITETKQVNIIMSKYKKYVGESYSDDDIARTIYHDWKKILATGTSS